MYVGHRIGLYVSGSLNICIWVIEHEFVKTTTSVTTVVTLVVVLTVTVARSTIKSPVIETDHKRRRY